MVINWTRLLGSPRIVVHSQDQTLSLIVAHSLGEHVADVTLERGIRRHDGAAHPHLVVVDLAAPYAIETLRAYTQGAAPIPALVAARNADLQPRLAAFANGADDVVTLPAAEAEVAARIRALLRRSYGQRLSFVPAANPVCAK